MSFAVVGYAHRNIFAVNGHPQGARYGGDPHQRSRRDLRLDLFRGLSLIFIFIDHVPDNVLSYLIEKRARRMASSTSASSVSGASRAALA